MARANSSPTLEVFQNISCYCLTQFHVGRRDSDTISKHLMLLFNRRVSSAQNNRVSISKHLMLLFNDTRYSTGVWSDWISKHLMLLFNMFRHKVNQNLRKFQNISCYCLTQLESERWEDEHISKHLMLLFNFICTVV